MARKKKYIKYNFADGERELPATIKVTCSVTGKECSMYHKQAVKVIEESFGNEYENFMENYVSREGRHESKDEESSQDEDRPKLYASVLKLQYQAEGDASKRQQIADTYYNRYGESIEI